MKRAGDNAFQEEKTASPRALRLKRDIYVLETDESSE